MSEELAFLMVVGAYIGVSIASSVGDLSYYRSIKNSPRRWGEDRAHARRRVVLLPFTIGMKILALLFIAYVSLLIQNS